MSEYLSARTTHALVVVSVSGLLGSVTSAGAINLSSWNVEDITGANWVTSDSGSSVTQTLAGGASRSVLMSGFDSSTLHVSGTVGVDSVFDDDFFGFVIGFEAGDSANASADYMVIDWKQRSQHSSFWGESIFASEGIALSRVKGTTLGDQGDIDAWTHTGAYEELARSGALGATGWDEFVTYGVEILASAERIQMWLSWEQDGQAYDLLALDVQADEGDAFPTGGFGFYSFSQEQVVFSDWRTVPAPGAAALAAMTGLVAVPRRRRER